MRPLYALLGLVGLGVVLGLISSKAHPGGDLPPAEIEAEKEKAELEKEKARVAKEQAQLDTSADAFEKVKSGGVVKATLTFMGKSPMQVEFYPSAAPQTVEHITALLKKGFYTGIKIHRYEDGSKGLKLVQMGDPESINASPDSFATKNVGTHGSGSGTVPLEIRLPHDQYSIGLARSQAENSGDSQLYINTDANHSLDGRYCVFGRVVSNQSQLADLRVGDRIQSFTTP
jgi:cyclophilin family peptidyl-prolyl cis-trans isomerase